MLSTGPPALVGGPICIGSGLGPHWLMAELAESCTSQQLSCICFDAVMYIWISLSLPLLAARGTLLALRLSGANGLSCVVNRGSQAEECLDLIITIHSKA